MFLLSANFKRTCLKALWGGVAAYLVMALLVSYVSIFVDSQKKHCLPWTVFIGFPYKGVVKRSDYVAFVAGENVFFGKRQGEWVGKQVLGMPGDLVNITPAGVFINQQRIGDIEQAIADKLERDVRSFDTQYTVEPHHYFVVGNQEHSYDSRYWGPIHENMIQKRLIGLW
jgi:conjugal transfer pilin signal peptidase TrbI